jgi:beta-glucosidase
MTQHLQTMRQLRSQGIPVVAVFLSGRPLWMNRELNLASAFVAAWLPGSEGGGVADLLFKKSDGSVAYDFRGKLSFSWPRTATGGPLNAEQPGYDPLFAFGFGLSYARPHELAQLPEDPGL